MSYLPYVNIKQGTKSVSRFSHGNTLPLTQLPFGMISFAPQTRGDGRWYYHPDDRSLEGVRLTHQPSPWIGDYGCLTLLPQAVKAEYHPGERWGGYRPEEAILTPSYLKVGFLKSRTTLELAPTERGAAIRVRFNDERAKYLSILPVGGNCSYKLENGKIYASTDYHMAGIAVNFRMYMVMELDGIDESATLVCAADGVNRPGTAIDGERAAIHIAINKPAVTGRLAISYISYEQAEITLERETTTCIEATRAQGDALWESYLSRIHVECETEEQMRTFYTCMWRAFLFPHKCHEIDKTGNTIHYVPCTGEVLPGVRYTDNGFWDTYRTVYPFFSIVAKAEYREMLEGFIGDYVEGGWLPRWVSIGEAGCMPSTLIDAVIADAAVKGILDGPLLETALEGMVHHAEHDSPDSRFGRSGASAYRTYGYVPYDLHGESVNLTLDAAYGDFCIAEVARILGKTDIEDTYRKTSKNWENLFDPATGFMRARNSAGEMRPDFSPISWGRDYTEAAAWQTTFAVPHDIMALAEKYGGVDAMLAKLDELFTMPPYYEVGGYGSEIHEMSEMAACDFGQCAISNQPSFHLPYLFAYLGAQEKTDYWVKKICDDVMSYRDDGFPGDEDNGTMAIWCIFSMLGLYPVCPGKPEFIKGIMQVKRAEILGKEWSNADFGHIIPYDAI